MRTATLLGALAGLLAPAGASAQDVESMAAGCVNAGGTVARCTELAATARALQGHIGLLSGAGSEVSGSASTLGRRLGTTPRFGIEARATFAHLGLPDLSDPGTEPSRETTFIVPAVRGGLAAGVFDGFSLMPTVGGFLSLDLLANGTLAFLPTSEGFAGKASAVTLGARVGILRESFTLPGVSVSVSRRMVGEITYGAADGAGGGSVDVDPDVTSMRVTVGKDLLAVGLLAGVGWDWYSGSAGVHAATGSGATATYSIDSLDSSRRMIFGGAALNFLILQLSAEVGWADGFGAVTDYRGAPFDPEAGSVYGSLAFRLTI